MKAHFPSWSQVRSYLRWLIPGIGIKRWVGLLLLGGLLTGLGLAYVLVDIYRTVGLPPAAGPLTLQFIPRLGRAALFGGAGLLAMLVAVVQINRTLLSPFLRPGQNLADVVGDYRRRERGPRIVAIGGGTGLSVLLRGLKHYTSNITAIVTVADDGGSSGRLRRSLGMLPPGDFRNCLAALADDDALTTQLFQYRFGADRELGGHSFGNLFITAMAEVAGSFERGLVESSRVLAVRGRVLPSTLQDVTLAAELEEPGSPISRVEGESQITLQPGAIRQVSLLPDGAAAYPGAIRAILEADLIVLGPGSLYTSLLPNLLVCDLAEAVRASRAEKVYVCNTATQPGETDGYGVLDHVAAIERHTGPGLFHLVLVNDNQAGRLPERLQWVRPEPPVNGSRRMITADVVDPARPWRHDAAKLARAVVGLLRSAAVLPTDQPEALGAPAFTSANIHKENPP